jgi:murein DD-endopeptidase MepM/ murein hydrolase activator NlpD
MADGDKYRMGAEANWIRMRSSAGAVVARRVRARSAALVAGPQAPGFSFIVDLAAEPLGPRWFRGAATLTALCAAALALSPGFNFLPTRFDSAPARVAQFQLNPMLGASAADTPPPPRPALSPEQMAKPVIAQTADAVRVQGAVTDGLYWSIRDAGVSPQVTAEYLQALATRIDVGSDVAPYDRFDLVIAKRSGQLEYAALHHAQGGGDVQLLKWNEDGRADWFDGSAGQAQSSGLMAPVAGRITSGFGMRYHPILHYERFHAGLDFGAPYGSPIVAAANGQVVAAGWAGGYGNEVQIAHGGGIVSLYGHMSGIVARAGEMVRQGQVIGYVGSTGLSTGPHLHFEVKVNGRAVNPLDVRLQTRSEINSADEAAFKARLKEMQSIGA